MTQPNPTTEALADVSEYQLRIREREAAYQAEAEATAAQHGYDTHALDFQYRRYQFGSLANNWEAADMRRKYWRALQLAQDRKRAGGQLIAAE